MDDDLSVSMLGGFVVKCECCVRAPARPSGELRTGTGAAPQQRRRGPGGREAGFGVIVLQRRSLGRLIGNDRGLLGGGVRETGPL